MATIEDAIRQAQREIAVNHGLRDDVVGLSTRLRRAQERIDAGLELLNREEDGGATVVQIGRMRWLLTHGSAS